MEKIYKLTLIVLCLFSAKAFSQCTTPTNTPYYEGFSSITLNNQLPNCWAISNSSTCLTFTGAGAGTNAAGFYNSPAGSNYFYSKGIQLFAGITYSTSLWHKVSSNSSVSWTDLSILIGTSQNNSGLTPIISTGGNILNTAYAALSNTFTVASSGVYYLAIKATSNGSGSGFYLTWDDLAVEVPCTTSYNSPSVAIVSNGTSFCSDDTVTLTATGADTYTWSNGFQGAVYVGAPFGGNISVVGTKNLSGCTNTTNLFVTIYASPNIVVVASSPAVCLGSSLILTALGASSYTWSNGAQSSTNTVMPNVLTNYSVVGIAANGCSGSSSLLINVLPIPTITYTSSAPSATICKGDLVTFKADLQSGSSHTWSTNNGGIVVTGDTFKLSPVATVTINLKGTGQNGCSSTFSSVLVVNECANLNEALKDAEIKIYPNPGTGTYHIISGNSEMKTIKVIDLAGKIIYSTQSQNNEILLNLNVYDNGIYHVIISTESSRYHYKIIKQQ